MPQTRTKAGVSAKLDNPSGESSVQLRSSGRIKSSSALKRGRTTEEDKNRAELFISRATSKRIESLESDNYEQPVQQKLDDDEFNPEEDDLYIALGGKKKGRRSFRASIEAREKRLSKQKNFNSVYQDAVLDTFPPHIPTYDTIAAAPSTLPSRHFCSVCGYFSSYTCIRCSSKYCSLKCEAAHKETRCLKFIV